MYFVPLWRITLEAPQYPEGLGLQIMLTDVQGVNEFDLRNINNLNHYIGMKRIEPDSIPELRIMPWAIALIIALALAAAATGKRWLLTTWVAVFVLLAVAGLVDFWLWEYDYGHNLDLEHAAIKVPGMSYQPPLIGSKQLLNFKAHSWPDVGGWVAILSLLTGIGVWWRGRARKTSAVKTAPRTAPLSASIAALTVALLAGCTRGPEEFHFGEDLGAYCRMPIVDGRFAAQIVTQTGRVYKFDSIECMASYLAFQVTDETDVHSVWVSNAAKPGELLPATDAVFVRHPSIRSPMGGGWAAYADDAAARGALEVLPAADSGETKVLLTSFIGMRNSVSPHR
jgi:copper chaperone NosL